MSLALVNLLDEKWQQSTDKPASKHQGNNKGGQALVSEEIQFFVQHHCTIVSTHWQSRRVIYKQVQCCYQGQTM